MPGDLSTRATCDEKIIAPAAWGALSKQCVMTRAGPSVFVSMVKRLTHEGHGGHIVIDVRSREHVASRQCGTLCQAFGAVCAADNFPPRNRVDDMVREQTRSWLRSITHLKSVFIIDVLPYKLAINSGMLTKVLRYLAASGSRPKEIVFLDCGLAHLATAPVPSTLLNLTIPCMAVIPPKQNVPGIFAANTEDFFKFRPQEWRRQMAALRIQAFLNLSSQPIPFSSSQMIMWEVGARYIPLRDSIGAQGYFHAALSHLFKANNEGLRLCLIDSGKFVAAAQAIALLLVYAGQQDTVSAIELAQRRLGSPPMDSFATAALSHLADTKIPDQERFKKAMACLGKRYDSTKESGMASTNTKSPTNTNQSPASPIEDDRLLQGAKPYGLTERMEMIQRTLKGQSRAQYAPAIELVQKLLTNVIREPGNPKYRLINGANAKVGHILANHKVAVEFIEAAGFECVGKGKAQWHLKSSANLQLVRDMLVFMASL